MVAAEVTIGDGNAPSGLTLTDPLPGADRWPLQVVAPAPCTQSCPAGVNVKAYVSLIAEGRFAEALEEVRRRCTLPSVCGRICPAPCEAACRRHPIDRPVAIRALKRFVADLGLANVTRAGAEPPLRDERVAVIGSGPAGLTAAFDLRRAGYPVTIFEAMPEMGGMLRYGIADYRLPPKVLDAEIEILLDAGIEVRTGHRIGGAAELKALLQGAYSAVLLALGAQRGRRLGIPGEDESDAVEDALGFLRRVNEGDRSPMSGSALVVGGGSTAVEAARTAMRLGASPVEIVYRRSRDEMPAGTEEVTQARREGIDLRFLESPVRVVVTNGALEGLECLQVALGEPDAGGRRRPIPSPGTEHLVKADRILVAIGQEAILDVFPQDTDLENGGRLVADDGTSMTRMWGVFAAGDVTSGPTTVIEAMAAGHRAAESIATYLETGTPQAPRPPPTPQPEYGLVDPPMNETAPVLPALGLPEPGREFAEVESGYTAAQAIAEASRCARCGPCAECVTCAPSCPRRHLLLRLTAIEGSTQWVPLRTTIDVTARIEGNGRAPELASIPGPGAAAEVIPMRVEYTNERCRGCGLCLDVCQFDALRLRDAADPESKIEFDPAACRGCALCAAICPTGALTPVAHSPLWWGSLLGSTARGRDTTEASPRRVVIRCDTGAAGTGPEADDGTVETIACRCVGQVHPGMLLQLVDRGAGHVSIEACGNCRFGAGVRLAAQHAADAKALLRAAGADWFVLELGTAPNTPTAAKGWG